MTKRERNRGREEARFDEGAKELLFLIGGIENEAELAAKLAGSRWRISAAGGAVDLITEEADLCLAVTVEAGWGVAVTAWSVTVSRNRPVRLDQRESSWSVFPRYEAGGNVFDGMKQLGMESKLSLVEVDYLLREIIAVLRLNWTVLVEENLLG